VVVFPSDFGMGILKPRGSWQSDVKDALEKGKDGMNPVADVTFEKVGAILAAHKKELAGSFGVSEIGVFGSVAAGTATDKSDVDVLVSFSRPVGFIAFMRLERRLQEILGRKIDLVTCKALRPYIGKRILSEVRFV
jgi:uncharacterized protein